MLNDDDKKWIRYTYSHASTDDVWRRLWDAYKKQTKTLEQERLMGKGVISGHVEERDAANTRILELNDHLGTSISAHRLTADKLTTANVRADTNAETAYRNRLEIGEAEKTIQALRAECHETNARIAELESQLKAANIDADQNGEMADAANASAEAAEQTAFERNMQLTRAESEAASLRVESGHARSRIAELERECLEANGLLANAGKERGRTEKPTEAEYDRVCLAVLCAEEMLKAANARIAELAAQIASSTSVQVNQGIALRDEIELRVAAHARADAAERVSAENGAAYQRELAQAKEAEARADAAERQLLTSQSVTAREIDRYGHAEAEAAALRIRIAETEQRRGQALRLCNEREGMLKSAESEAAALRAEVERLREQSEARGQSWQAAVDKLDAARADLSAMASRCIRSERSEEVAKSSLAEARALIKTVARNQWYIEEAGVLQSVIWGDLRDWLAANPEPGSRAAAQDARWNMPEEKS